jgi:GT2 family glycosyltransferase
VVVLAYGSGGQHEPLLASLLEAEVAPASILLVHNPAAPGEPAPRVPDGVEVLQTGRNLGYAAGMNAGIERQRRRGAQWLLLLTHDARLRPGAFATLVEAGRHELDYGVLAPALVFTGTDRPFSFGGVSRPNGSVAHVTDPPPVSDGVFRCDWVDGGTLLLRSSVIDEVGGFEERFWGYWEETDLCLRARRAGYHVGVVVAAHADQDPGAMKRPGAWAYLLTRNGHEYARRAAGTRGVVAAAAGGVQAVGLYLLRTAVRGLGVRPGDPRETWVLAVATARGMVDFFRGRWGPPPRGLPGTGDVHNA